MGERTRAVFFKQSGEQLALDGRGLNADAVRRVVDNIHDAYTAAPGLGISGMTVTSGGGNFVRGQQLAEDGIAVPHIADALGRFAIVANTLVIAESLEARGIPTRRLLPPTMSIEDTRAGLRLEPYSPKTVHEAHQRGEIAFLAGWPGENGVTSDAAIIRCAGQYSEYCGTVNGRTRPDLVVLKGTQFDGVFDEDPRTSTTEPRRYRTISAHDMLGDYERLGAVDRDSLAKIIDYRLQLLIYNNLHPLRQILESPYDNDVGTLVVPDRTAPTYHDGVPALASFGALSLEAAVLPTFAPAAGPGA